MGGNNHCSMKISKKLRIRGVEIHGGIKSRMHVHFDELLSRLLLYAKKKSDAENNNYC